MYSIIIGSSQCIYLSCGFFFLLGTCLVVVIALIGLVNHGQLAAFFHVVLYLKCGVADYTCSFVELNQAKVLVC